MNVARLLSGNAERYPGKPALIFEGRAISFDELEERSGRVATAVAGLGVRKGDVVALLSRNRPEWVEVFFGVAKLGAILVPLNFRLQSDEIRFILERTAPKLLVGEEELVGAVGDVPTLAFEGEYEHRLAAVVPSTDRLELSDEEPHSIGFTSGTTGVPKGALLTQANVVIGTHYYSLSNIGYSRDDVFLNPTPLCHRAGWARLVQSVGVGASQVLLRKFDPEAVFDLVERHRITMSGFVPTMVRLMSQHRTRNDVSSMKQLLTTGEACPPATKEMIFELFPGVTLLTTFASTEAGILAISSSRDEQAPVEATGRPLPEVEMRIGDDSEIQVRTGRPGTGGVMRQYFRDPEATRAAYSEDGFFLTGDCGFLDDDGYLHVTDRKRDMIVSGGLNIYSKEVESCLLAHPDVLEAAVVGKPDPTWGEAVVAFVVRRNGREVDAETLVSHCKERLASYKKPKDVRFVSSLPMNAAGKILKYRLRSENDT